MSFVTITTKDGREYNGVQHQQWQTYQEALDDEISSRAGAKKGKVDKVYSNGKVIYDSNIKRATSKAVLREVGSRR